MWRKTAELYEAVLAREGSPGWSQPWWNQGNPFTKKEIEDVYPTTPYSPKEEWKRCTNLDSRECHARQIAKIWRALDKGDQLDPIDLSNEGLPGDGLHRLVAYHLRNLPEIECKEKRYDYRSQSSRRRRGCKTPRGRSSHHLRTRGCAEGSLSSTS